MGSSRYGRAASDRIPLSQWTVSVSSALPEVSSFTSRSGDWSVTALSLDAGHTFESTGKR